MKKCTMVILFGLFFSCGAKHFTKQDYTFYNEGFKLQPNAALRTDGVYILEKIWTDENGGTTKKPKVHTFYRFYSTGQCNMVLDIDNTITTLQQYTDAIAKASAKNNATLFESYYKLEGNKIVIQGIKAHPVKQFEYKYGYVTNDELIIVKATIEGKGKFEEKYFTDYYKEHYKFMPLDNVNDYPNW